MKFISAIVFAIFLVACNSATPTPEPTANVSAILTVTAPVKAGSVSSSATSAASAVTGKRPLIIAHRGGAGLAPENTLGAFDNALKLGGVDMLECDVHLSKDGELIIMHDPNVSTTTDGNGQISELTFAEIKKLNDAAKFADKKWSPQVVPTLGEVLDLVKGKVGIQIEIKNTATGGRYPGIEKQVIDLINARGMANDVIVISFDFPTLKEVKAINSRIKTGALVRADWFMLRSPEKSVSDAIDPTGADYLMPTASPVNQQIVDAAHARGIKMGVWTVDTQAEMKRYAGFGIDAITTNRPDELKKALGR